MLSKLPLEEDGYLRGLLYNIPEYERGTYNSDRVYYTENLFPYTDDVEFYKCIGSLTTPVCNEVVTWFVGTQVKVASQGQLDKLNSVLHNNYRPVQEFNGREISMNSL